MPANEFDRQVKERLDEFRLDPSASVWKNVEKQIREKKRRRVILFFILPAMLGLLGFMAYMFTYSGPKRDNTVISRNEKPLPGDQSNNRSKETNKQANDITSNKTDDKQKEVVGQSSDKETKSQSSKKDQEPTVATAQRNKKAVKGISKKKPAKANQEGQLVMDVEDPSKKKQPETINKEEDIVKSDEAQPVEKLDTASKADVAINKETVDSAIAKTVTPDTTTKTTLTQVHRKKIKWGIDIFAGVSNIDEGVSLGGAKRLDAFANASSPPVTGSVGGGYAVRPPSSVSSGASFRIGATGELQVSRKSRFSSGLQYVYASNHITTGNKQDTAIRLANNSYFTIVDQVYRGAANHSYTNRYHFIQVPFWYHLQLNKGKKLPIQWDMGLSFNYLIATNALVYDSTSGGIYFQGKKAFNKTHFNLGTGLSFRLRSKNGMEWVLGPSISFDMSKLLNNPYEAKQYLYYAGFGTRLLFPRKKNK